jgi:hypothetical protein
MSPQALLMTLFPENTSPVERSSDSHDGLVPWADPYIAGLMEQHRRDIAAEQSAMDQGRDSGWLPQPRGKLRRADTSRRWMSAQVRDFTVCVTQ